MLSDLKYALRQIRRNPGFSLVAVLTLALGIGANTAIFSLVESTILKLLPAKDPGQLVALTWDTKLWPPNFGNTGANDARFSFSYPAFEELRQSGALESVFAFVPLGFSVANTTVTLNGEATLANGLMVTGEYFSGLGVNPILGRAIGEKDEAKEAPRVAVLSYDYWTRRFNRDPGVIGQVVKLNDIPVRIVGVTPRGFHGIMPAFAVDPDLWVALADLPTLRPWGRSHSPGRSVFNIRNWACLDVVGRLRPSTPRSQAESRLDVAFRRFLTTDWKQARPEQVPHLRLIDAGRGLVAMRDEIKTPLAVLMSAVGLLLLIACANLATLLLARAAGRQKEISVRLAVGASRWRIIRQLLVESGVLALLGGGASLFVARGGIYVLMRIIGDASPAFDVSLDPWVLGFAAALAVITGLLFGLAPAFRASKLDLAGAMKQSSGASEGRKGQRLGKTLVVAQVAASAALMIVAGLFVRTLEMVAKRHLGYNQTQLIVFGLDATRKGYHGEKLVNLYGQLRRDLQALPGVRAVTLYGSLPYLGHNNTNFSIVGSARKIDNDNAQWNTGGPDFCATLQIPLISGRDFRESDGPDAPRVGLITETFARHFFGAENPLGQRFTGPDGKNAFEVVGVVKDVELSDLRAEPVPKAFVPYSQLSGQLNAIYFEVRAAGSSAAVVASARAAVRRTDSDLPLMDLSTQDERIQFALLEERLLAQAGSFFGAAALLLSCIGLYGTLAYTVTRRTREIGIRMALGARPSNVLGMILGQGMRLILLGIVLGVAASLGLTRAIQSLFYGISANDPATFCLAASALLLVALLACWLPARRATKVDPIVALREE